MRLLSFTCEFRGYPMPLFSLSSNYFHLQISDGFVSRKSNDNDMAPPTASRPFIDAGIWAVDRAISLIEVWALVAAFSGLVGAWRLLGVCRAARAGAKVNLGSLPRLVVCGEDVNAPG